MQKNSALKSASVECYSDPLGYVSWNFPWGEGELRGFDGPDKWQEDYLAELGEAVKARGFDGVNAVEAIRMATTSGHGIGKALAYGEPVLTPVGWVPIEALQPGDEVISIDGTATEVLSVHPQGVRPLFQVLFNDGTHVKADAEHTWAFTPTRLTNHPPYTTTTRGIIAQLARNPELYSRVRMLSVPQYTPVKHPNIYLPANPYDVGFNAATTNPDDYVRPPDIYFRAGTEQRIALLQGYMDKVGIFRRPLHPRVTERNLQVAADVCEIVRSLGGYAKLTHIGELRAWSLFVPEGIVPCRLSPKVMKFVTPPRVPRRFVESVTPIGSAPAVCIRVAHPSHLFITRNYIATHNSSLTAWLIKWVMFTRPHCKGVVTANTLPQLETKTWAELAKWHRMGRDEPWFGISTGKNSLKYYHKDFPESWRCDGQTCKEENSESFAGLHAANSTPFYIFDEASNVPDKIYEVAEGGLTDGEPMIFLFGNPTRNTGRFRECWGKFGHRWRTRQIDSRSVRITNKKLLGEWVEDYGEDSDFVRVRVRGVFPRAGSSQLIASDIVEESSRREPVTAVKEPLIMGVDVARFGDDASVIMLRHGNDARHLLERHRGVDTMWLAGRVAQVAADKRPDAVFVDETGVGGGVLDRLRQLGIKAIGVNFSASPSGAVDGEIASNKRTEMWVRMRNWLKKGGAIPNDRDLMADLSGVEYGFDGRNALQLEKKSEMKARGLASPDAGDALALTFAYPVVVNDPGRLTPLSRRSAIKGDYNPFHDAHQA